MAEKRFINDIDIGRLVDTKGELSTIDYSDTVDFYELWEFLNKLSDENKQLKSKNKELKDKYERKDRQLKRTKKDIEKYTDYFMNELNWDCDRIIKEVFR